MPNPNIKIVHKLKAIDRWETYIGLCGIAVRKTATTSDITEVTCKNCLRTINNRINEND